MKCIFILLVVVLLLPGCTKTNAPTPTSQVAKTYPAGSGATVESPAANPTNSPAYPAAGETVEPTALPISSGSVQIFLIAMEDNGKSGKAVGCGDSVVPVEIMVDPGADALRTGLDTLLGLKDPYYGQSGLYTALYQSTLQVEKIEIETNEIKVELSGQMMLGGECDNPRVKGQLEETVAPFAQGRQVKITINGKDLDEALSLK